MANPPTVRELTETHQEKLLRRVREPFPQETVGLLPKQHRRNVPESEKSKCPQCEAFVGPHIHLSYIGWAAVVDRLLEVDPLWEWRPYATDELGLPAYRQSLNGTEVELWITLTVAGVTKVGVGVVDKSADDLAKKLVSDALKNAANKFGVALYLWTKDELESLIGNQTVASSRRRAPRSQTSTTGSRAERSDGGANAADKNKILRLLAHLDPPVTAPSEAAVYVAHLIGDESVTSLTKISAEQAKAALEMLEPSQAANAPAGAEQASLL